MLERYYVGNSYAWLDEVDEDRFVIVAVLDGEDWCYDATHEWMTCEDSDGNSKIWSEWTHAWEAAQNFLQRRSSGREWVVHLEPVPDYDPENPDYEVEVSSRGESYVYTTQGTWMKRGEPGLLWSGGYHQAMDHADTFIRNQNQWGKQPFSRSPQAQEQAASMNRLR